MPGKAKKRTIRLKTMTALAVVTALAAPSGALAAPSDDVYAYDNRFNKDTYEMWEGQVPKLRNAGQYVHQLNSTARGPDGFALFRTPEVYSGGAIGIKGTRYLRAGKYPFYCTIFPSMTGRLVVKPGGGIRLKRPVGILRFITRSIGAATRSQKIWMSARIQTAPDQPVPATARLYWGKREITSRLVKPKPGKRKIFEFELFGTSFLRKLKKMGSVKLRAVITPDFGSPRKFYARLK